MYYYIRDNFGNILGLVNSDGEVVVNYSYDACGNVIEVTGSKKSTLGIDNPFIYKGYYYDKESKMYYCHTRYYVPEWGRFLNADDVNYLDPSSINGLNLFTYCYNNPVLCLLRSQSILIKNRINLNSIRNTI